jgi:hypothetical protein
MAGTSPHPEFVQPRDHTVQMVDYESLFAAKPAEPKEQVDEPNDFLSLPSFLDGRTPAEIEEYISKRQAAIAQRNSAMEAHRAVILPDIGWDTLATMNRSIADFGKELAGNSQDITDDTIEIARIQMTEALGAASLKAIDDPTFVVATLSLARMAEKAKAPGEKGAASLALASLNKEELRADLERIRQEEELGPHTGELAVQAIIDHELISA